MRLGRKVVRSQVYHYDVGPVRRSGEIPGRQGRLVERVAETVGHRILRHGVPVAVVARRSASRVGDERVVGAEVAGHDAAERLVAVFGFGFEGFVLRTAFGSVAAGQRVADELDVASGRWRCGEEPSVPCESECVERRAPLFALGAFLHSQRVLSLAESFGQYHEGIRAECRDDAGIVSVEGQVVVIPFRVRDAYGQRTACETAFEIGSAPVETHAAAGRLRTSHIPDFGGCGG